MAVVAEIHNHDILGIVSRINRFVSELVKCASATQGSGMSEADIKRLKAYHAALGGYAEWVVGQPQLDLPETHPRVYSVPEDPDAGGVENETVADVIQLLIVLRDEMLLSQSSKVACGLTTHDEVRFDGVMEKVDKFITDYIEPHTPLDLPESSPKAGGRAKK